MSYLIVIIVDNPDDSTEILDALRQLGVSGATVLESTGMGRIKKHGLREDFPLLPNLADFLNVRDEHSLTILSVVETEEIADRMAAAAQRIIGDLDDPHTGFMFVMPVLKAYGLGRK